MVAKTKPKSTRSFWTRWESKPTTEQTMLQNRQPILGGTSSNMPSKKVAQNAAGEFSSERSVAYQMLTTWNILNISKLRDNKNNRKTA